MARDPGLRNAHLPLHHSTRGIPDGGYSRVVTYTCGHDAHLYDNLDPLNGPCRGCDGCDYRLGGDGHADVSFAFHF